MRKLVIASAILASLLIMPLGVLAASPSASPGPTTPPTDAKRATDALGYLQSAQKFNGSIDASIGETADYVIGAAAAGYDPSTLVGCPNTDSGPAASALSYLAGASDGAAADAAKTGKAILAVLAAGRDPANFAGRNLTARLAALYHSATGAYGDGSTFGQSFAVLAVVASGGTVPAAAVAELKALQDPDGSWSYGTAPVAAGQGDTNSTAIALMALDVAGNRTADATGLAYLRTQQLADGGFPYQNSDAYGPPTSDPDSDSIVLQALVAAGQNPTGANWLKGAKSVLTHLRTTQAASGGFAYPGQAPNAFTTSQVPAALSQIPYAHAVHWTAGRRPPIECISTPATGMPAPTPSVGATPTPSVGATPTLTPTAIPTATPTPAPTAVPTPAARRTVRPVVQPTPSILPADSPAPTDTAAPTATVVPTEDLAAADASGPTEQAAGVTFSPGDSSPSPSDSSVPTPLIYLAVAVLGLGVVLGGGWVYINRPWTR